MATYCQVHELAETMSLLNGMWSEGPIEPCRKAPVFEVHVENVLGLIAQLCTADEQLVSLTPGYQGSVPLRVPTRT